MITLFSIKQTNANKQIRLAALAVIGVALLISGSITSTVVADQYDQKISQLQSQNNNLEAQTNVLASEAVGYQAMIDNLAAEISNLEAQIRVNDTKRRELEAEIARHKDVLGQNIRAMYVEGQMSTFEVLASSNDLGSFVDKQQYRNTVKDKITQSINTINELKGKLEKVIADQRSAQSRLDSQRAEQGRLLALNQSQRAALDAEIKNNSSQIAKLRSEQAAANARLFGNGLRNVADSSGYPWANVPFPNELSDPWGMYKRQCVSYTAWKVAHSGRYMPYWGGRGNANQWDDNARAAGISVDRSPRVGDVAISNSGTYGHAMYVEAVNGDGTIYVSQYNAGWTGRYSEARIPIGSLVFIHF